MNTEKIKNVIRKSYGDFAKGGTNESCCTDKACCATEEVITSMSEDYVVISNCVMNLIPDKEKAFKEVFRTLKTGGHFSISDIVYSGSLPIGILEAAELYAGCVAGASEKGAYLGIIKSVGFKNIQIKKQRPIELPDELLLRDLSFQELDHFRKSGSGIFSITIYADKLEEGACCEANGSGCCSSEISVNDETEKVSCCGGASSISNGKGCCG